jgi:hypothetical protein
LTKDLNINFGSGMTLTHGDKRPYKNPIFKLMFFVDGGDFKFQDLMAVYSSTEDKFLPNVICILNRGILVKAQSEGSTLGSIELFPEFISPENASEYKWAFLELGEGTDPLAAHLAFVHFALNQHLRNCIVTRPDLMKYFAHLFKLKAGSVFTSPIIK